MTDREGLGCDKCRDEHVQLRKWLAELKSLEGKHNALVDKYNALADRYRKRLNILEY